MLELSNLKLEQLRQVYEWDNAPEIESFESYSNRLSRADWAHYSINDGADFIGCVSLELTDATTASIHLAMKPRTARVKELRRILIDLGIILFESGIKTLTCEVTPENRAARWLVGMCGMVAPDELQDGYYRFQLTIEEFQSDPQRWN